MKHEARRCWNIAKPIARFRPVQHESNRERRVSGVCDTAPLKRHRENACQYTKAGKSAQLDLPAYGVTWDDAASLEASSSIPAVHNLASTSVRSLSPFVQSSSRVSSASL